MLFKEIECRVIESENLPDIFVVCMLATIYFVTFVRVLVFHVCVCYLSSIGERVLAKFFIISIFFIIRGSSKLIIVV
jgi:hypothetical protein